MLKSRGIICGCDRNLEWLLPWFLKNYQLHNELPITFFDFGMSIDGIKFCKLNGNYLSIDHLVPLSTPIHSISDDYLNQFAITHPIDYLKLCHHAWMKKPLACQLAPYDISIWIDIDCKVMKNLDEIYQLLDPSAEICLSLDHPASTHLKKVLGMLASDEPAFSSGVMIFRKNSPFIQYWIDKISKQFFPGDQEALSKAIYEHGISYKILDQKFHLCDQNEQSIEPSILHYGGPEGKVKLIEELFGKKPPLEETAPQKDNL